MSPPLATGRQRAKKPKTRTGCISCKSRRVKCDEGKPACLKCIKSRVRCEGYRTPHLPNVEEKGQGRHVFRILSQKNVAEPHVNPLLDPLAFTSPFGQDPAQNRYFLFFREETIAELSGPFEEGLFSTVALQACYFEPALMRLVSALGALHKSSRSFDKSPEASIHKHQALLCYSFALAGIQKMIKKPTLRSPRLVLIAALLIFCFENLHGNVETASLHLQAALRLLRKQLAETRYKYRHTSGRSPTADIEESIIGSYVRLDRGIYSCLKTKLEQALPTSDVYGILNINYSEDQAIPSTFISIHGARKHLEALQFHCLPILTKEFHNRIQSTSSAIPTLDEGKTEAYLTALRGFQAWNRAFAPLYYRAMGSSSLVTKGGRNPELTGAAIMRARGMTTILAIQVLLPVLCDPVIAGSNVGGNNLTQNCNEVLTLTRFICEDPDFRRDFVLDCGVLPGLFMVIIAPVGARINREALELMRSMVPRREGVWASANLVIAGEAFLRGSQVQGGWEYI